MTKRRVISGGNWSDSTIWEGGILPELLDEVCIDVEEDITVTIDTNVDIKSIDSSENLIWSTGTIKVANGLFNNAIFDFNNSVKRFEGELHNSNVINQNNSVSSSSALYLINGSKINNESDATYQFDAGWIRPFTDPGYLGSSAEFNNAGTFLKTTAGRSDIDVVLNNTGSMDINRGSLYLDNLFNHTGSLTIGDNISSASVYIQGGGNANNTSLDIGLNSQIHLSSDYTLGNQTAINGQGTLNLVDNGVLTFDINETTFDNNLKWVFDDGQLDYIGNFQVDDYTLSNDVRGSEILVQENSTLSFLDGTWSNGYLTVDDRTRFDGTLTLDNSTKYLEGDLYNYGVINQNNSVSSSSALYLINGSKINNESDATYQFDAGWIRPFTDPGYLGSSAEFNNAGTFLKTTAGRSDIDVVLNNTGSMDINRGSLYLDNLFNHTGSLTIGDNISSASVYIQGGGNANNTSLDIGLNSQIHLSSDYTLGNQTAINGQGTLNLVDNGVLTFDINETTFDNNLKWVFDDGQLDYIGNFQVDDYTLSNDVRGSEILVQENSTLSFLDGTWSNGYLTVDDRTRFDGTLTLDNSTKYLEGDLYNYGVINQNNSVSSSSALYLINGSKINNESDATYQFDAGWIRPFTDPGYLGSSAEFNNAGTFLKTTAGRSDIDVVLNNTGSMDINRGSLYLDNLFNHTGSLTIGDNISSASVYIQGGGNANNTSLDIGLNSQIHLSSDYTLGNQTAINGQGTLNLVDNGVLTFDINETTFDNNLKWVFDDGQLDYIGNFQVDDYTLSNDVRGSEILVQENSTLSFLDGTWSNGYLTVDDRTRFDGTLTLDNSTKYLEGDLYNYGVINQNNSFSSSSALYVVNASKLHNQVGATYQFNSGWIRQSSTDGGVTEATFDNHGTLHKSAASASYIDVDLFNSGIIETDAGNLYIRNDFINTGTVNIRAGIAHFTSDVDQTAGEIILHNGRLNSDQEMNIQAGEIGGYGTVNSSILNSGLLNPFVDGDLGSELGDINITGDYTETDTAQINFQVGGEDRGTEYDAIDISGVANFDGTINVSLINDFFPVLGDRFDIITYASYTGDTELDFTGLNIGNGLRLNPIFSDTGLSLVVGASNVPDAQSDAYGVNQDQVLTILPEGVLANDNHPDNDTLIVELQDATQFGTVELDNNGAFTYTPNLGFLGTDSFTYKAVDSDGDFDIATVTINVTSPPIEIDLPPIVANPIFGVSVLPNAEALTINLSTVFTDVDDDDTLITKSLKTNSNENLVSVAVANDQLTLTFASDQTGQADITIQGLSDGQTVDETFTIFVRENNDDPEPDDLAPIVANHIPAEIVGLNAPNSVIDLSTVFTDPDNNDGLIVKSIQSVSNLDLFESYDLIGNELTLDYAPDQFGEAQITILAESNGKTVTDLFTVYVQSPDVDNPPFVSNPLIDFNRSVNAATETIDLSAVFSDVDNNDSSIIKTLFGNTNPDLVNASIDGNNLRLDYSDTLKGSTDITVLAISNGKLTQDTFTINVINRLPEAINPIEDQSVNEGESFSLFIGDVFSDSDGDPITYEVIKPSWLDYDDVTQTLSGTPRNTHVGTATITVQASDSDGTASDSFDLTVVDQPNGTFRIENATYTVNEDNGILTVDVIRDDSSLGDVGVQLSTQNDTATSPSDYQGGVFDLTFGNGEIMSQEMVKIPINDDDLPEGGIEQIPETFNLILSNPTGGAVLGDQSMAIVSIMDNEPAVAIPIAVDDTKNANALEIITIDVLGNDYDPDNYRLPIELHRLFVNGEEYDPYAEATITTDLGGIISIFNNGTPDDRTDDQLYYTAPDAEVGTTETFTYTIRDGERPTDFISEPAAVSLTIIPDDRTPTDNFNITLNGNTVNYDEDEVNSFADQDLNGSFTLYDQNTIDLDGNTWKAIALKDYGYTDGYVISTDTILTFDFKSNTLGEIQGVAWSTENLISTEINPDNVINLYGSNAGYGINDFDYAGAGNWQTVSLNLSEYGDGLINYLIFVGDDDDNNRGDTQIRNLSLNQDSTNRRPTNISLSDNTLDEEQAIGTLIGTLSTNDLDADEIHTYTLVSGQGDEDNALFSIENNQLITNEVFDYETQETYTVRIQTTDLAGTSYSEDFTITVNNIVENQIIGTDGKDKLRGTLSDEHFDGLGEFDRIIATQDTNFTATEGTLTGEGNDTFINIELLQLTGGISDNILDGSALTTTRVSFNGKDGNDTLLGGAANDIFRGGFGDDNFDGADGIDRIIATQDTNFTATEGTLTGEGNDTFINIERLQLTGGNSDNTLDGSTLITTRAFFNSKDGDDTLLGGAANDNLIAGNGSDVLSGGKGNDFLRLGTNDLQTDRIYYALGDGTDTVQEFEQGMDILNFSGISAIDVVFAGSHTQFREADAIFGKGDLLMTVRDVIGFNNADIGVTLLGNTAFNFA